MIALSLPIKTWLTVRQVVCIFPERWLTCVKTLSPPRTETWGFRGQNKEKDGNEDCYCGVRHIPEKWSDKGMNKLSYVKVSSKEIIGKIWLKMRKYLCTNSALELKISVAQPSTKPGSLVNHITTSRIKRPRTLISPKDMGPSRRCCSQITL